MHKVDLPPGCKEAATIEARREREKQRQTRIFNARHRTMGVDVEALKSQVEERKLREETEKRRDEAFDAERVLCDQVAQMLELEERQRVRCLHQALQESWERDQPPHARREWDLNNPEGLRLDQPARVSDADPRCGPASLQRFAGEDLMLPTRRQLQQQQQRHSLEKQRAERQQALATSKYTDTLEDKKRVELDLRAQHLALLEEECHRAKDLATANYNQAQAAEVAERRRLAHQQEQDDNQAEIHNHLTGQLLTENPAVAESPLGPHRVLTDRWKGMSPQQVEAVWKAQEQQRQENQVSKGREGKGRILPAGRQVAQASRESGEASSVGGPTQQGVEGSPKWGQQVLWRLSPGDSGTVLSPVPLLAPQRLQEAEQQRETEWEAQRQLAARAAMALAEEQQLGRLQLRKDLDAYNQQLAQEQRAHQQYLQKEVYTNAPSAQYHLQFNTSSR
ncbi:RIB43A-like with coiled-coils protein 1 [Carettochelys insculpta]|uniref:RIB43A-like with coiled-coils protein 1 n=1 Tax=Carettochelys insculpta TaxID=44489 RepID=UPI003EBEF4C9